MTVACLGLPLLSSGCLYVSEQGPSVGWQREPRDELDDWRDVDMKSLMASPSSNIWFIVDERQRGTARGYGTGGMTVTEKGGWFELGIIYRKDSLPMQEAVRVYFDESTPVYANKANVGTVLGGITDQQGYDVTQGGKILDVPFHINGGRMYADRVTVSDLSEPRVP